jgi:hypothetical protein
MVRVVFVCVLLMLAGRVAEAQVQPVGPGSRIMVWTESRIGPLDVVSADGAMIEARDAGGATVRLDLGQARRIDVSRRRSLGEGAARGLLLGALVSAGIGAVAGFAVKDEFFGDTAFDRALLGAGVFGAGGAVLGLVGGALNPGNTWTRLEPPVSVRVRPHDSRLSIGLAARF